jgi:hypothetical protein
MKAQRNRRQAFADGYAAGRNAARRELEDEFLRIKDDIAASRAHLRRVELLDYFASAERNWSALLN